jgi:hypothetical protein
MAVLFAFAWIVAVLACHTFVYPINVDARSASGIMW